MILSVWPVAVASLGKPRASGDDPELSRADAHAAA